MTKIVVGKDWLSNLLPYPLKKAYIFGDTKIILDDSHINADRDTCVWYNETALAVCSAHMGYEERDRQLKRLIKAFIEDVTTQKERNIQ